ncbi:MAG: penicillin acylase family protein [Acetobacteraceae bacterium]
MSNKRQVRHTGSVPRNGDLPVDRGAKPRDRSMEGAVGGVVEILRDHAGVPHVRATATRDLFFGLGVAMAEDRLWQMDRLRRRALGRQAEILGRSYLASDRAHLTVGIDEISTRDAAAMDEPTRRIVEAFVAGINREIETAGTRLPIEFRLLDYSPEPFSVRDIVAIGRGIWWSLNGRIDRLAAAEAARFFPTETLRGLYLTPEASEHAVLGGRPAASGGRFAAGTDDATGSNNWALGPARTGTGAAILAGDPHQPFWVPSSWYEFVLEGPEDHAGGAGHPGLPGLWWGANGATAWSITNNAGSTRDLYRETVKPDDPRLYRDHGTWRPFQERRMRIPIRGEPAAEITIRATVRGPVVNALIPAVSEGGDPPLSLRWVGAEHLDDLRAMIAVSRARSWRHFRAALEDWAVAVFNFVYADRDGHIGYQMAGRIPLRGRVTYGFRDADNEDDAWQGMIPFEALPHIADPVSGFVASANQRIVDESFAWPIYGAYSQGHRGMRIESELAPPRIMGRTANVRLQNDIVSNRARRLCPYILGLLGPSTEPAVRQVVSLLAGWDGGYSGASAAPTVFETFMGLWQRAVLARHLPERLIGLAAQQTGLAAALLEGVEPDYFSEGTPARAAAVAEAAIDALTARLGPRSEEWRWKRVHLVHWKHPLSAISTDGRFDIGPAAVDGGSHTICNTGGELPPHEANSGAEYRMIVDFIEPQRFLAVQNIGNSGVPDSPHYRDQFEDWKAGRYHVIELETARVDAEATMKIRPLDS